MPATYPDDPIGSAEDYAGRAHLVQPAPEPTRFVISWSMFTTQCQLLAGAVRGLHGLGGHVVGVRPLWGAEVPAAMVSGLTGIPVVDHVSSGVVLVGLVARHCAEAQRWVNTIGEGLAGVLWAYRTPEAPVELAPTSLAGLGDGPVFPVTGASVAGADWLVMPWEADREGAYVVQVGP